MKDEIATEPRSGSPALSKKRKTLASNCPHPSILPQERHCVKSSIP